VVSFAGSLEEAALETVASGIMTGDLLLVADKSPNNRKVNTEAFIGAIGKRLQKKRYA